MTWRRDFQDVGYQYYSPSSTEPFVTSSRLARENATSASSLEVCFSRVKICAIWGTLDAGPEFESALTADGLLSATTLRCSSKLPCGSCLIGRLASLQYQTTGSLLIVGESYEWHIVEPQSNCNKTFFQWTLFTWMSLCSCQNPAKK